MGEGNSIGIQLAQQRIQASLSLVSTGATGIVGAEVTHLEPSSDTAGDGEGDMQVEQKWVGWLLGKSGIVLKEIELQSGARITIDQSTKDLGFSTVHISGDWQQSSSARQLIQDKVAQAGGPASG